jgi:hypothetical protein
MIDSMSNFLQLSRDLRYEYECYSFNNDDKHAKNMLVTIRKIKECLRELKSEVVSERKLVLLYESEFTELEELFKPTLERLFVKMNPEVQKPENQNYTPKKYQKKETNESV